MGEDYDYKDIYDFDLTKFENRNDYYEGLEDDISIEKNFTEEELEDFKNKVKKYCENLIEDILYVNDLSEDELAKEICMELENISGEEYFSETILEDFYGQQDLFFEYAKEIAPEIACEYKDKRHEKAKNEIKSKIEEILKNSLFSSEALSDIIKLLEKNETYKTIDDPYIIRKFISREPRKLDSYIPSEILEYIDLKLIQEDDELMEDILNCWIAPEKYLAGLKEGIGYTEYYNTGIGVVEDYEVYEHYNGKIDLSEYYEKFYQKVISENKNGVGTPNEDYDLYYVSMQKMPSKTFNRLGGFEKFHEEDMDEIFSWNFIVNKLIEENRFEDVEDFIYLDDENKASFIDTITRMENNGKFDGWSNEDLRKEIRKYIVKLSEEILEQDCLDTMKDIRKGKFLINAYIREGRELPEDIKEIMNIKEEEIERIKKEYELEKLQEEDRKCDEALELVEKLDKNKEQEGQTQDDD